MCQLIDWRKEFAVFDKPRVYFFSSYKYSASPSAHMSTRLTLCSVADSRVVPKLQPVNPYPPRSVWQRASVAVVATRDCIFHYVSENCPQADLQASRDLISFLQRYSDNLSAF
jgi:hypothetical protein